MIGNRLHSLSSNEMSSALRACDSSLSNDILKYAKMLIDSSGGKYSNLLNACFNLNETQLCISDLMEINDAIKRMKLLEIIVFIDDAPIGFMIQK